MERSRPDLIISDLHLPQMTGDELCKRVKSDPATRDIYFIILSALDGTASRIGGLSLGADDMIPKPFHAQEVLAKVDSTFRLIEMQKRSSARIGSSPPSNSGGRKRWSWRPPSRWGCYPKSPGRHWALTTPIDTSGFGHRRRHLLDPAPARWRTAMMIADVSGHGVTAALISAMVKTSFENQVRLGGEPLAWAYE